jgi:AcrR family transcriptional regulator
MVQNSNDRSDSNGPDRLRRRADARRLEILRAAARVFRRQGFSSTGMREIASEAGLSPGNLYYYFAGKQELLYFCQDRSLDRLLAAVQSARLSGQPVAAKLRDILEAHVHCLLDDLEGSSAHLEIDALPPDLRRHIVAKRDRYERAVRRLLSAGVKSGELADCDTKVVTRAMLGAASWTAQWFRPEGPQTVSHVATSLADYLVRGLEASGARRQNRGRVRSGGSQ